LGFVGDGGRVVEPGPTVTGSQEIWTDLVTFGERDRETRGTHGTLDKEEKKGENPYSHDLYD
jgi:hypothetical protein